MSDNFESRTEPDVSWYGWHHSENEWTTWRSHRTRIWQIMFSWTYNPQCVRESGRLVSQKQKLVACTTIANPLLPSVLYTTQWVSLQPFDPIPAKARKQVFNMFSSNKMTSECSSVLLLACIEAYKHLGCYMRQPNVSSIVNSENSTLYSEAKVCTFVQLLSVTEAAIMDWATFMPDSLTIIMPLTCKTS